MAPLLAGIGHGRPILLERCCSDARSPVTAQRRRKSSTMTSALPPLPKAHNRQPALAGQEKPISAGHSANALSAAPNCPPGHCSKRTALAKERSHNRMPRSSFNQGRLTTKSARSASHEFSDRRFQEPAAEIRRRSRLIVFPERPRQGSQGLFHGRRGEKIECTLLVALFLISDVVHPDRGMPMASTGRSPSGLRRLSR